jgi:VanZ family protein
MLVIFGASTDLMSAEHTSRFIGPFLRWFDPAISPAVVLEIQFAVRKAAHVTEYAFLGALLFRAIGIDPSRSTALISGIATALAAACAVLDEFHQSFVPSRTGSPVDVMIDIIGTLIGIAIYAALMRRHSIRDDSIIGKEV